VAQCEGVAFESYCAAVAWMKRREVSDDELNAQHAYQYSTGWAQGGPIIEREMFVLWPIAGYVDEKRKWSCRPSGYGKTQHGPTPLIAAMRCYVASKLGDEVEVPEELKC
jgi:hypothetical protein